MPYLFGESLDSSCGQVSAETLTADLLPSLGIRV